MDVLLLALVLVLLLGEIALAAALWTVARRPSPAAAPHAEDERVAALASRLDTLARRLEAVAAEAGASRGGGTRGGAEPATREDLEALERRVRAETVEALARRGGADVAGLDEEAAVLAALRREGYRAPRLLGRAASGSGWRVEVEREGTVQKGLVELDAAGRARVDLSAAHRAFP